MKIPQILTILFALLSLCLTAAASYNDPQKTVGLFGYLSRMAESVGDFFGYDCRDLKVSAARAVFDGDAHLLKRYIANNAPLNDRSFNPLTLALLMQRSDLVQILLHNGADPSLIPKVPEYLRGEYFKRLAKKYYWWALLRYHLWPLKSSKYIPRRRVRWQDFQRAELGQSCPAVNNPYYR